MPQTPRIIVVTSQKGGVAKTTTAVTLAAGLAVGFSTLLADLDPQGHASIAVGLDPAPGVFRFFVSGDDHVLRTTDKGMTLLPGNSRTRTAESVLRAEQTVDQMIERFRRLLPAFDFIVIDTPASGLFQEVAVRMADDLVIPVRCEALGLDGVAATLQLSQRIGNPGQTIILPTMFDKRLNEHRINLDQLRQAYGEMVADPVPARVAVAEATACGRTVWEPGGGALEEVQAAYAGLLDRIHGIRGVAL